MARLFADKLARLPVMLLVFLALSMAAPLLAGCATPEQRTAEARADVERMMAIYGPACERLGYAVQSDAWRSCVLNLSTKYELQRYATSPGYYGWGGGYWHPNGWWGPYW